MLTVRVRSRSPNLYRVNSRFDSWYRKIWCIVNTRPQKVKWVVAYQSEGIWFSTTKDPFKSGGYSDTSQLILITILFRNASWNAGWRQKGTQYRVIGYSDSDTILFLTKTDHLSWDSPREQLDRIDHGIVKNLLLRSSSWRGRPRHTAGNMGSKPIRRFGYFRLFRWTHLSIMG